MINKALHHNASSPASGIFAILVGMQCHSTPPRPQLRNTDTHLARSLIKMVRTKTSTLQSVVAKRTFAGRKELSDCTRVQLYAREKSIIRNIARSKEIMKRHKDDKEVQAMQRDLIFAMESYWVEIARERFSRGIKEWH